MGSCISNLNVKDKAVYNSLVDAVGEQKAFAIYQKDDMFSRSVGDTDSSIDSRSYSKDTYFKTLQNGNESKLYNELIKTDPDVIPYFDVAYSDRFTKIHPWSEMQQITEKKELNEFIEDNNIDLNNYYKTLEPKVEIVESHKEVVDLAESKFSKNLNLSKKLNKDAIEEDTNKMLIKKYVISVFEKKYGVKVNVITKENLPKGAKGIKGWYNTASGSIFLVEDELTTDTPFHEMFHPILDVIKRKHPAVYHSLLVDVDNYKDKKWYKAVIEKYGELNPLALQDELIVTAVGMESSDLIKQSSAWGKFIEMINDFLSKLDQDIRDTFGIKGNVIDLNKVSSMSIADISKVIVSESIVFKDIEAEIKENVLFYDVKGNPVKISDDKSFREYLVSFSKNLENEESSSTDKALKVNTIINKLVQESNDIDIAKANRVKNKYTEYQSPTKYLNDNIDNLGDIDFAIRQYVARQEEAINGKGAFNVLKKNKRLFEEKLKSIRKAYDKGNFPEIDKIMQEKKEILKFYSEIGNNGHDFNKRFFERVDELRVTNMKVDAANLSMIKNDMLEQLEIEGKFDEIEMHSDLIDGLIDFVNDIEKRYAGKNPRYLAEINLKSDKIKKFGKADLIVIADDGVFSVFDTKFKKTEKDTDSSFERNWNTGYTKLKGSYVWNSGREKTSIQASMYSLMLSIENEELKEDFNGALYVEAHAERSEEDEGSLRLTKINLRKSTSGKSYLTLIDRRTLILESVDSELKKELFKDKLSEEGKLNSVNDIMDTLLGDKVVDKRDYEKQALNKYEHLDQNPSDVTDFGLLKSDIIMAGDVQVGGEFISFKEMPKDEALKILEEHYKEIDSINKRNIDNVLSFHETGDFTFNKSIKAKEQALIRSMLQGISSDWDLKKLSSIPGMEDNDSPILVATNTKTGKSRLLYFSTSPSDKMSFKKGSDVRKTILGNLVSDKYVKVKFKNSKLRDANKENFRLVETTMIAMKLKYLNPSFNMDRMIISTGLTSGSKPKPFSLVSTLPLIEKIKVFIEEESEIGGHMNAIFSDNKLFDAENYAPDYIDNLLSVFNESLLITEKERESVSSVIEGYRLGQNVQLEVYDILRKIRLDLIDRIEAEGGNAKFEMANEMIAISNAVLDLAGINNQVITEKGNFVTDYFVLERNNPEYLVRSLNSEIHKNSVQVRREVDIYNQEADRLLSNLAKSKGVNLKERRLKGSLLGLYSNMFENTDNFSDKKTLMKLKDPELRPGDSAYLNEAEREYIRYFNKTISDASKYLAPKLYMDADTDEKIEDVTKGWVPIQKASVQSKSALGFTMEEQEVRDAVEEEKNQITRSEVPKTLSGRFANHLYLSGLDVANNEIREDFNAKEDIEMNLEIVMKSVLVESIEAKVHDRTAFVYEALRSSIEGEAFLFGSEESVKRIVMHFDEIRDKFIFSESALKTKADRITAKINNAATGMVIVSGKQAIMDTMTFGFSSSSYVVANTLEVLFNKLDKNAVKHQLGFFTLGSWVKAGKLMLTNKDLYRKIQASFGLDESEAMYMKSVNAMKSARSNWMEIGFTPTRTAMKAIHMQVMFASMIHDGSINAYSLNEDGSLNYDETKDPRFYENGKIIDEPFLKAVKEQALSEGYSLEAYDPDNPKDLMERKLVVGYTFKERESIRSKAVDMIGVIGPEGSTRLSQVAVLRNFVKFRSWVIPKAGLYFRKNHISEVYSEWERTIDVDGNVKYNLRATETEGIVQSVHSIIFKLWVYKGKVAKNGGLSSIEKKNLAILASHLMHWGILIGLSSALYLTCSEDENGEGGCWVDKTRAGKSAKSLLENVQGDLMTPLSVYSMIFDDNSLFGGISAMLNMSFRILKEPYNIITNDTDMSAVELMNKDMVSSWAAYRDVFSIFELIMTEDKPIEGFDNVFPIDEPISNDVKKSMDDMLSGKTKK